MDKFIVSVADDSHLIYADDISRLIEDSAKKRGTGIARRSSEYIGSKIKDGKAIIALGPNKELAGFCYIESWQDQAYVANSGLIVNPDFRNMGLAQAIKKKAFKLSRKLFPEARLFGLTTSLAVMKINSDLGYRPVTFNKLTADETFWKGCASCVNYEILQSKKQENCLCTGMLFDPSEKKRQWERKTKKVKDKIKAWKKKVTN
ncbi:MAG: GNAT family N-acetyltransferase [Cyclobacteriaceae bacterium]